MPQCEWPGATIVQEQVFLLLNFKVEKIQKSIEHGIVTNILSRKAYPDQDIKKSILMPATLKINCESQEVHFAS